MCLHAGSHRCWGHLELGRHVRHAWLVLVSAKKLNHQCQRQHGFVKWCHSAVALKGRFIATLRVSYRQVKKDHEHDHDHCTLVAQ